MKTGNEKVKEMLNELNRTPEFLYDNRFVPYAGDIGVEPDCEGMDAYSKETAVMAVEMRYCLLAAIDRAMSEDFAKGLWRSDALRSYVMLFKPKGVDLHHDVAGDFMRLAVAMRMIKAIMERTPVIERCPLGSVKVLKAGLNVAIADAERAADQEAER